MADLIGVAGDVKHRALDEEGAWPTVYRPVLQTPSALSSVLFGTGGFDPVNIAIPAAVLVFVGVCAVLPAARRAANTDPLTALRSE